MRHAARGFTLLETLIALAILAMSLTVLLQGQAQSLASAGRTRDTSVAVLLARSKMIDIEQKMFHDGFTLNTEDEEGDFADEDHPEVHWRWRASEVQLDLTSLTSMCKMVAGGHGGGKNADEATSKVEECESMLQTIGAMAGGMTDELAHAMRAVELLVTWPEGIYEQNINLRYLMTRDDFGTQVEGDAARQQREMGQPPSGAQPGAAPAGQPGAPL